MRTPHLPAVLFCAWLAGCAAVPDEREATAPIDGRRLPAPDVELAIAGLGPCTDAADRTLHLDSRQPVNVLVHGCFSSAGRFRALAQVYAFQGQQAVCFSYDDRDRLSTSAAQLTAALAQLRRHTQSRDLTVIGHSQGGLVARRALAGAAADAIDADLRLVTISAPYAGIGAADHCGSRLLRVASLGLVAPICHLVTGAKWSEIHFASRFIREPAALSPRVREFLKLETDERDSCRRHDEHGDCREDDYVFSLAEQRQPAIDGRAPIVVQQVRAGHVEIVGNARTVPDKLIAILQQRGFLAATEPERRVAFEALLQRLYLGEG